MLLHERLMYTYALDITRHKFGENTFSQGLSRHEARTDEATSGRVGRGEQGEARPENSVPRSRPKLVLSRRRLKIWSKSGLTIAEATWSTY